MSECPSWMTPDDDAILERVDSEGPVPIRMVAGGIILAPEQVDARVRELAEHGLLSIEEGDRCIINDDGRVYLAGELDASELEDSDA